MLGVGLLALGAQLFVQTVTAAPAAASLIQPVLVTADSAYDSRQVKWATAQCPPGSKVIGGGGWVYDSSGTTNSDEMVLPNQMVPFEQDDPDGGPADFFAVQAAEPSGRFPNGGPSGADVHPANWFVEAQAVCAYNVPGWQIVRSDTPMSVDLFKEVDARCPAGKQTLSSGAMISGTYNGYVNLEMVRPDGYLSEGRAAAIRNGWQYVTTDGSGLIAPELGHDPIINTNAWSLSAFAVCANPIGQFGVGQVLVDTHADAICPLGSLVSGSGAGGSPFYPGGPWYLRGINIRSDLRGATATMSYSDPQGMVAQATCA